MANIKTVALSEEQYKNIIQTMMAGSSIFKPNRKAATALVLQANLGLRISDVVKMRLCDIVRDGDRYRLNITEQKTGKLRTFTVPPDIRHYIYEYADEMGIKSTEYLFPRSFSDKNIPISTAAIQKHLRTIIEFLGYEKLHLSTHSFRKFYATRIYQQNDYNIVLVQRLLQHSSPSVTQRYIGLGDKDLEQAIEKCTFLIDPDNNHK